MEKHVIINVTSVQRDETGKDEKITLETPGIYGEEGNMRYVSYRETKLAGMEVTTTTLRVYEDHVSLLREGTFLQEQEYRIGKSSKSTYQTLMGPLEVTVVTRSIEDSLTGGEGKVVLTYDVELKGLFNHLNEVVIEVREDPEYSWKSENN